MTLNLNILLCMRLICNIIKIGIKTVWYICYWLQLKLAILTLYVSMNLKLSRASYLRGNVTSSQFACVPNPYLPLTRPIAVCSHEHNLIRQAYYVGWSDLN